MFALFLLNFIFFQTQLNYFVLYCIVSLCLTLYANE